MPTTRKIQVNVAWLLAFRTYTKQFQWAYIRSDICHGTPCHNTYIGRQRAGTLIPTLKHTQSHWLIIQENVLPLTTLNIKTASLLKTSLHYFLSKDKKKVWFTINILVIKIKLPPISLTDIIRMVWLAERKCRLFKCNGGDAHNLWHWQLVIKNQRG